MAIRQQPVVNWRVALLIGGGLLLLLLILGAIDAVADGIRNLLVAMGVPVEIAGNVGAIIFGGVLLILVVYVVRALLSR